MHNNLAVELERLGDVRGATDHYLKAIEINPRAVEANNNLANLYATQSKFDEAQRH